MDVSMGIMEGAEYAANKTIAEMCSVCHGIQVMHVMTPKTVHSIECSGSAATVMHPPLLPGPALILIIRSPPSWLSKYLILTNRNRRAVPLERYISQVTLRVGVEFYF